MPSEIGINAGEINQVASREIGSGSVGEANMQKKVKTLLRQHRQLIKLFEIFKSANGRQPAGLGELERWMNSPEGQTALTPYLDVDGKVISDRRKFNRVSGQPRA
jgi:hypothetical protein